MKKNTKTALMIASACVILGSVIFAAVAFRIGGQWEKLNMNNPQFDEREYTYSGTSVTGLDISEQTGNLNIVPSEDGDVHITCWESEKQYYEKDLSAGGILSINVKSDMAWYDYIQIGAYTQEMGLTVAVPAELSGDIDLLITSGDIGVYGITTAAGITAKCISGKIELSDVTAAGDVSVEIQSGDIKLSRVVSGGAVEFNILSGDITTKYVTSKALFCTVTTGDIGISFSDLGNTDIESTSGNILLERDACGDIALSAVSGDIKALITGSADDYDITARAKSGKERVPWHTGGEKRMNVQTTSGDIEIAFAE
ncbi:MAG: DUF4097 family beta strand repeat-containing protein [Oscillospiraceae bacterium]